jgi:predicted secreted hydrolase
LVSAVHCIAAISIACVVSPAALATPDAPEPDYAIVVPGYEIELPRDEGSHPGFRTEWWYLTGWLQTGEAGAGEPLGFQITFFRSRPGVDEQNPSRFAAHQLLFAHAALSDPKLGALRRAEKSAREGFGLAAAKQGSLDVHIDDWFMRGSGERYRTVASAEGLTLDLNLSRTQPPLLQGKAGFSQKGPKPHSASYYYSLPQLRVDGRVVVDGRSRNVTGVAWFDHEWSTAYMDADARGWDWIGINFDDGAALMAFRMRDERGGKYWAAATSRPGAGDDATAYGTTDVEWTPVREWRSPRTGARYPVEWKVAVGGRTIVLRPLMDDQENDARASTGTIYWEGAVRAFDERGRAVGRGYLELTGYGSSVRF